MGKLVSSTPRSSMRSWNHFRMTFQMYMLAGRMMKKPEIWAGWVSLDEVSIGSLPYLVVVLDHFGLENDFLVPRGKVLFLLGGDANNVVRLLALAHGQRCLLGGLCGLVGRHLCLLFGLLERALGLLGGLVRHGGL